MSYVSEALGGQGGIGIGDVLLSPDVGVDITREDLSYFLRSGSIASAASYPRAAALDHMKVVGVLATNATSINVTQVADNGAGTIIVCYGATSVLRSTDYGATWATVSVNSALSGQACTAVVWTGSRFIIAANNSSNTFLAYSTTGASFTAGANSAAYSGATSSSVRGVWNGTLAFFVVASTTASGSMVTTADGATLTNRASPSAGLTNIRLAANGSIVAVYDRTPAAGTTFYTTTDASSYNSRTAPTTVYEIGAAGGLFIITPGAGSAGSPYYTTTDGATFTARQLQLIDFGNWVQSRLTHDGTRAYLTFINSPYAVYTTDGVNWHRRSFSATPDTSFTFWCHAGMVLLPSGYSSTAIYKIANWNTADYVGEPMVTSVGNAGSSTKSLVVYKRLA